MAEFEQLVTEARRLLAGEEKPWPIDQEDVPFLGRYFEGCGLFDSYVECRERVAGPRQD